MLKYLMAVHIFLEIYFLRKKASLNISEMLIRRTSIKLGAILKFAYTMQDACHIFD